MTLEKWVSLNGGAKQVSKILGHGACGATVWMWINRGNLPRARVMQKIYKLSKGRVSYRTMVEGALKVQDVVKKRK